MTAAAPSRTEKRKTYMALYHLRRRAAAAAGAPTTGNYSTEQWTARAHYLAEGMYPESLLGLSDDEMITEMHERTEKALRDFVTRGEQRAEYMRRYHEQRKAVEQ